MSATALAAPATPAPARRLDPLALLALPGLAFLGVVFLLPLLLLLWSSIRGAEGFSLQGYVRVLGDPYYVGVIGASLQLGLVTTLGALLLGYPAAFALARAKGGWQVLLFALVFLPLTVSIIVKSFGWGIVLRRDGILNWAMLNLGLIERPVRMIFTEGALYAGMINVFLPFMVLPIYSVVRMMDPRLPDAAATLGASPWFRFTRVTLPLSLPGVVAGVSLVFSLAVAAYVTPSLLMGDRYMTMSMVMAKAFLNLRDWQLGAAMAAVLLAVAAFVVVGASVLQRRLGGR
ncbi:ABC transporter permease [Paracraurococcus ruber]|uniref:ABC transporter permease n=1 Tax=Paracraurococcus ruber TaxID=77675 RepID=A0ABS1D2W9_9PROT|nr:ABC transporter permease [Paracraurococcus ruber]MBK1660437.1 ABC transporter permease [Paracraurococcus ruber]TDG33558.1 ABC transporter permease [Paracraurococcus ruber]